MNSCCPSPCGSTTTVRTRGSLPNCSNGLSDPVYGQHYYEKWTGYFNRNLWDMIAYFRGEGENGQKFCDMMAVQVELYTKSRREYGTR